jgi:hypothetical protein
VGRFGCFSVVVFVLFPCLQDVCKFVSSEWAALRLPGPSLAWFACFRFVFLMKLILQKIKK